VLLYIVTLLVLVVAIAEYAIKGEIRYEVSAIALLFGGVVGILLTWLVQNSPYDMLQKLRETILAM
jgi:uncharacterized membrane protein HdeD (DUF308 family)